MVDPFVADRAVQVVGAVGQGNLRRTHTQGDPVGLDVIEVVQQQTADGDRPQVLKPADPREMAQSIALRMEGQRDDGLKTARPVLECSKRSRWSTRCAAVSRWP